MESGKLERQRNSLIQAEQLVLELLLIVYPFLLITSEFFLASQYLWIIATLLIGVITYLLFKKIVYTMVIGLILSAFMSIPFYFIGLPVVIVLVLFTYTFWRLNANFGNERENNWPYLIFNTFFFTLFYFLLGNIFVNGMPELIKNYSVYLYMITTILFFLVRFTVLGMLGRKISTFSLVDAVKMFTGVIFLGAATFMVVLYLLNPIRMGIVYVGGFLFGGIFMFISEKITPAIENLIDMIYAFKEKYTEDPITPFVDFYLEDETVVFGKTFTGMDLVMSIGVLLIVIISLIFIFRYMKKKQSIEDGNVFNIKSSVRLKKKKNKQLVYDYSAATDVVRKAFKNFEEEAQLSKSSRLKGETVREWFTRMSWECHETLFTVYDRVRYGSQNVTTEEGQIFVEELEQIKKVYLSNDV